MAQFGLIEFGGNVWKPSQRSEKERVWVRRDRDVFGTVKLTLRSRIGDDLKTASNALYVATLQDGQQKVEYELDRPDITAAEEILGVAEFARGEGAQTLVFEKLEEKVLAEILNRRERIDFLKDHVVS